MSGAGAHILGMNYRTLFPMSQTETSLLRLAEALTRAEFAGIADKNLAETWGSGSLEEAGRAKAASVSDTP